VKTAETDATWAKQSLRDAALRATAARVAVLQVLAVTAIPMSHAAVVEALAEDGFDQSTLFRCPNAIADAGLVSRLDLGDHTRRFELRRTSDGVEDTHLHFICVGCGELTCLKDYSVQITPSRGTQTNTLGTVTEVMIRGRCGNCVKD